MRARLLFAFLLLPSVAIAHGEGLLIGLVGGQALGVFIALIIAFLPSLRKIGRAVAPTSAILLCTVVWSFSPLDYEMLERFNYRNDAMFLVGVLPPALAAVLSYFVFRRNRPKNA